MDDDGVVVIIVVVVVDIIAVVTAATAGWLALLRIWQSVLSLAVVVVVIGASGF